MKSVTQEKPFGCAVACVAFIANTSYKNALKLFKNQTNHINKGYYCKDIVKALKNAGFNYKYCYAKPSKRKLKTEENIIVFVKRSKKYPAGHYLARKNKKWMNPWINFPSINSAESGFSKNIPEEIKWIIYPERSQKNNECFKH